MIGYDDTKEHLRAIERKSEFLQERIVAKR